MMFRKLQSVVMSKVGCGLLWVALLVIKLSRLFLMGADTADRLIDRYKNGTKGGE